MPIASMYGICPFIWLIFMVDGGEHKIAYMDPTGYIYIYSSWLYIFIIRVRSNILQS